jgi:energy-coupling factor transport system permease protein
MFQAIPLGTYYPGKSFIHRLQARTKLLLIGWLAVFLTLANHRVWHFVPYIVVALLLFAAIALSGISLGFMWRRMRLLVLFSVIGVIPAIFFSSASDTRTLGTWGPLLVPYSVARVVLAIFGFTLLYFLLAWWLPLPGSRSRWFRRVRILLIFLALIALAFLWVTRHRPASASFPLGPVIFTYDGIWLIFSLFVVFLALFSFSLILTMTTSPIALIEGLTRLLTPLRWLRLPVDDFAMMTLIALRFIPTLLEEMELLVKAQTSRGADLMHGSLRERLQSLAALFIPFIHGTLRRASELATALEARGYEVQGRQTPLHDTVFRRSDYLVMGVVVIVTIGVLLL